MARSMSLQITGSADHKHQQEGRPITSEKFGEVIKSDFEFGISVSYVSPGFMDGIIGVKKREECVSKKKE